MTHKMKLVDFAFNAIKAGTKDIEIRLNDEKRRLINVGDKIEFTNVDSGDTIMVDVIKLHHFDNFNDLFDAFPNRRFGFKNTDDASIMNNFYTKEEEKEYGVLGIEISLNKENNA